MSGTQQDERTPWFPSTIKPVRKGFCESHWLIGSQIRLRYWDGDLWQADGLAKAMASARWRLRFATRTRTAARLQPCAFSYQSSINSSALCNSSIPRLSTPASALATVFSNRDSVGLLPSSTSRSNHTPQVQ